MSESEFQMVVTTVGSRAEAQAMAKQLVERRLAACAQISEIESYYTWQGELQHDPEFRLLLKTTPDRCEELTAAVRKLHSYDLPAIYAVTPTDVLPAFAEWVQQMTR